MSMRCFSIVTLILLLLALPIAAQDFEEGPGPGLGGIVINSSTAGDPATFNPLHRR